MTAASALFGVGIRGLTLDREERAILARDPPRAVILFRRNIESVDQVLELTAQIRRVAGSPLLCVDQEGGRVDRFRDALVPSISFREAAEAGVAKRAGQLAGEACARLGFDVDLAPVVDRLLPGASELVLRDRCASSDPAQIIRAATDFVAGLQGAGTGACVKHFPGLGRADLDTHKDLPGLPDDAEQAALDLEPFVATMESAGAVMISHAAGPDGVPASLSRRVSQELLRETLGFTGASFSDDLEMGALSSWGDLARRSVLAAAGCDLLFVCSQISIYPECVEAVQRNLPAERREEASTRLDRYAERLERIRGQISISRPGRPLDDLRADMSRLAAASRGKSERGGGGGASL